MCQSRTVACDVRHVRTPQCPHHRLYTLSTSLDCLLLKSAQINMCDIQVKTYARCRRNPSHQVRGDYLRCAVALARPKQHVCVPASGQQRDLPFSLDAQDTNVAGECPVYSVRTPSNSSDSN
jgi:hypothetical protein